MNTPAWRRYLRFWRPDVEDDVDEELRFHIEMRERDYIAAGRTPDEAHAEAMQRFGSAAEVRDSCYGIGHQRQRQRRVADFFLGVRNDLVFAVRQLARNRGFAIAAILTLALGIGANGLVFGLVNSVLLRPLPGVSAPDRLIAMNDYSVSYPGYRDFRDNNAALSGLAAFSDRSTAVSNGHRTTVASVGIVSGNYFDVLGVRPALGRGLAPADDDALAAPVAVLSAAFARSFFPGDDNLVGRTIDLNGAPVEVVGVASKDFHGTELDAPEQLWISIHAWWSLAPASFSQLGVEQRRWSWLQMIGRLKPAATISAAAAALDVSAARQNAAFPNEATYLAKAVSASPPVPAAQGAMSSVPHGTIVRSATIVLAVVILVLLIACANVSNLLLARATSRRREIGVRIAIGASRGRVIRQLLTETVVLAAIAAVIGLAATLIATRAMSHVVLGSDISFATLGAHVDGRVTAYTVLIALFAILAFGTAPALQSTSESGTIDSLKDGTPGAGRSRSRVRRGLLVAQVALSLTLLIGAGLFTRSLEYALATDPGFDGSHVATAGINVGLIRHDSARAGEIYDAVIRELSRKPGVRSAALGTVLPLERGSDSEGFRLDDYIPPRGPNSGLELDDVTPHFMQVFSIPLLHGRLFNDQDRASSRHVAIVNETMATRYWRNRDPLGKRILFDDDTVTIVGVVRDTKYHDLREPAQPFVYRVLGQHLSSSGLFPQSLAVRGTGDPAQLIGVIRRTMRDVAPEVPVYDIATFEQHTGHVVLAQRLGATVLGLFGTLALMITAVGIYGVVGYGVTQRTREMGIRIALGARGRSVLAIVLIDNLATIAIGLVIGILLSIALTRTISSFLFGVSAMDGVTFASACFVLLTVGTTAALIPALRATRVDPAVALRSE